MTVWLQNTGATAPLRHWLKAGGSLSEHIRRSCKESFRVQPVYQGRARAGADELAAIAQPAGSFPLVREVVLRDGLTAVVFARSMAAAEHLNGPWRGLRGLGSRPLATMLFTDAMVRRGALEYCRICPRSALYRRAARALGTLPPELWARRSVFMRTTAPLLVTEVFLPDILTLEAPDIHCG